MNLADQQVGRFLSYISHDIRSPISSIMTLCEVLEVGTYGELNQRQQQALQELQSNGRNFLNLLNDVVDLAKATQGKLILNPEILSVNELLQEVNYLTHESFLKKRQTLVHNTESETLQLITDEKRVKQILLFMLEQSIVHSSPNTEVKLSISVHGQQLIFRLSNVSLNFDTEKPIDGLNFIFVQQLAQLLGGECIYAEADNANYFSLSLPWQAREETRQKKSDEELLIHYENREKLILLAEQDMMQAQALMDFLLAQGYQVKTVFNGAEAVQQALNSLPQFIIMAIDLAELDGFSATQQIKATKSIQQIPILLCSAADNDEYDTRAKQVGAMAYLQKPFSLKQLQSFL